jgi:hypothetical protein
MPRVWVHITDGGDGSAGVKFFASQEEATASAHEELEEYGQSLNDNVTYFDLEFDAHGQLVDYR